MWRGGKRPGRRRQVCRFVGQAVPLPAGAGSEETGTAVGRRRYPGNVHRSKGLDAVPRRASRPSATAPAHEQATSRPSYATSGSGMLPAPVTGEGRQQDDHGYAPEHYGEHPPGNLREIVSPAGRQLRSLGLVSVVVRVGRAGRPRRPRSPSQTRPAHTMSPNRPDHKIVDRTKIRDGAVANRPVYVAMPSPSRAGGRSWGYGPAMAVRAPSTGCTSSPRSRTGASATC